MVKRLKLALAGMGAVVLLCGCQIEGKTELFLNDLEQSQDQTIELAIDLGFQDCEENYEQFLQIVGEFGNIYPIGCTTGDYGGIIAFEVDVAQRRYDREPELSASLLDNEFFQFAIWPSQATNTQNIALIADLGALNKTAKDVSYLATLSASNLSDLKIRLNNRRGNTELEAWFPFSSISGQTYDFQDRTTIPSGSRLDLTLPEEAWKKLIENDAVVIGSLSRATS